MLENIHKIKSIGDFMFNPRREIEIFGMFGAGNLGDEAMLVAAKKEVGEYRCVPWRYSNNSLLNKIILSTKHKRLFIVGGTLIHGGKTGWLDYVEHRFNQSVPLYFFGTGIAFTESEVLNKSNTFQRWSNILSRSSNVWLRGSQSVELAKEMGATAKVFGDFALLLYDKKIPLPPLEGRKDIIGLNFGECLGDQRDFEEKSAKVVFNLKSRHRLVFHAVVRSDVPVIMRIAARAGLSLNDAEIEQHYTDPHAFMNSIRDYRAFLGLKLHAAGLAMIAGVPSLMIAYLPKARDFMTPLGGREDLIVDLPMNVDNVLEKLSVLLDKPAAGILIESISRIHDHQKRILQDAILSS